MDNSSSGSELALKFKRRRSCREVTETVTIARPMEVVFDAVTTSYIWVSCYPDTVAVGGISKRPFKPGDLVLEKFLFGGSMYCVFQYEIAEYDPPSHILFHGKVAFTNDKRYGPFGKAIDKFGLSFEYRLKENAGRSTTWERKVYVYHAGGLLTDIAFRWFMRKGHDTVERGAKFFVDRVKVLLESGEYAKEIWNGDNAPPQRPLARAS